MKKAPLVCGLVLGAVGFSCGFFGPMILSPDANQGPLIGILISGPGGALLGLVLGVIVTAVGLSARIARRLLITTSLVLAGVTLYASTPAPQYVGRIVDAEVADCAAPTSVVRMTPSASKMLVTSTFDGGNCSGPPRQSHLPT